MEILILLQSGFSVGVFAEFEARENFAVMPQLLYTNVDEANFIQLPVFK